MAVAPSEDTVKGPFEWNVDKEEEKMLIGPEEVWVLYELELTKKPLVPIERVEAYPETVLSVITEKYPSAVFTILTLAVV